MKREPIVINGQQIGRFRASWLLVKESARFLQADKEILWFPIVMFFFEVFCFGLLVGAFVLGFVSFGEETATQYEKILSYAFLFGLYVIGAFGFAFAQAGITHIVFTRLHGGDATFGEGFSKAFSHAPALFLWALITSTVGLVLNMISERSKLLGRIVAAILGTAWAVLTYFVVQAVVLDKKGVVEGIRHSSITFRRTWGETLVSNVSLSLIFLCAHLLVLLASGGLGVFFIVENLPFLALGVLSFYVIWFFAAILVQTSLESILRVLLYVYAGEHVVPANFNQELLGQILGRSKVSQPEAESPNPNPGTHTV